ncbi:phosphate ABC transporter ATP-binding protein PstB [Ligilactobacillus sp. LYQ139]|uniref:phosphate ABC transporter ATP-binding protein PstB n=1 Tax=Ligilactobacillus sp. LYQ139 TaxID=3378800 RepID=UPI003854E20E
MKITEKYIRKIDTPVALSTNEVAVYYGDKQAFTGGTIEFPRHRITALIGPSGCGKSTFLRSLNRMNDGVARVEGQIMYHGLDINTAAVNVYELRKHIGMVFQHPNPFYKSIRENITYALKYHGVREQDVLEQKVEESLRAVALWDEVKDSLDKNGRRLSGGQQQRLCIARAIAMEPDILLLDEPTSGLDPISTRKVENTLQELKQRYTIIIVTHNMQQASRSSDYTAFLNWGQIVEFDETAQIFTTPHVQMTEDYVSGNFG